MKPRDVEVGIKVQSALEAAKAQQAAIAEAVAEERNAWIEAADTEALSPDETYASGARNVKERVLAAIRARGEQDDG